jgi:hypothetical protein
MLTGVEILLERMKTNPEEFVEGGYSKWTRVLDAGWAIMTDDEREALQAGMIEAKRDHFNGEVMRVLSQGHDDHLMAEGYSQHLAKSMMATKNAVASSIITPDVMRQQVQETLEKQFDEAYARQDKKTMQTASKLKGMMRK